MTKHIILSYMLTAVLSITIVGVNSQYDDKNDDSDFKMVNNDTGPGARVPAPPPPPSPGTSTGTGGKGTGEADKNALRVQLEKGDGPKDALEMAGRVLQKAWANNMNGVNETSVLALLPTANMIGGEERLHLLRLLELMDKNSNYMISSTEMVGLYTSGVACPDLGLELMFKAMDYDGNGFISTYETLTQLLAVDGINLNIIDKWTEAQRINFEMDGDGNGIVSLQEFQVYMVWQLNLGIGKTAAMSVSTV